MRDYRPPVNSSEFLVTTILMIDAENSHYLAPVFSHQKLEYLLFLCGEQSFPRKHLNCGKISMRVQPFY